MDVTCCKLAGKRLGIFLQRGTRWGMPVVVRRDPHVENVHVGDVITHVDGRRYWSTRAVASAIVKTGPTVTLTVRADSPRELTRPLVEDGSRRVHSL